MYEWIQKLHECLCSPHPGWLIRSPQTSCGDRLPKNKLSSYRRWLSQGGMALIKACEKPTVTRDRFLLELPYKKEGAVQSQHLSDETEGLNSEEVVKMDWEKGMFSTRLSTSLPQRAVMIAGPGLLIYWEPSFMSRVTGSIYTDLSFCPLACLCCLF